MRNSRLYKKKSPKTPRKIMVVTPSKYGMFEAIRANKKYWKSVFDEIDETASETVSTLLISQILINLIMYFKKKLSSLD